jgi:uncharacterized membrane protein (UPF0127 family)
LIIGLLTIWAMAALAADQTAQVCFEERCIQAEVVTTLERQMTGLMYRETLARDRGMLFIYSEEVWPRMYMKNMKIPLDMIWISKDREVVEIAERVPVCREEPCPRYGSEKPARYVLEINAGLAEEWGIRRGDRITFSGNGLNEHGESVV